MFDDYFNDSEDYEGSEDYEAFIEYKDSIKSEEDLPSAKKENTPSALQLLYDCLPKEHLPDEETRRLIRLIQNNDPEKEAALERLTIYNLRLVIDLVRKTVKAEERISEYITEAWFGLKEAAEHYWLNSEYAFTTYLSNWVFAKVRYERSQVFDGFRVPMSWVDTRTKVYKAFDEHGIIDSKEELVRITGCTEAQIDRAFSLRVSSVLTELLDSKRFKDNVVLQEEVVSREEVVVKEMSEELSQFFLKELTPLERAIYNDWLDTRYSEKAKKYIHPTYRELAKKYGISPSGARYKIKNIVKKIKQFMISKDW